MMLKGHTRWPVTRVFPLEFGNPYNLTYEPLLYNRQLWWARQYKPTNGAIGAIGRLLKPQQRSTGRTDQLNTRITRATRWVQVPLSPQR